MRRKLHKRKIHALDLYVTFSILMLLIFTAITLYLTFTTGFTNDALTIAFFGFFGGEIVTCALIKIFKLRQNNEDLSGNDDLSDF